SHRVAVARDGLDDRRAAGLLLDRVLEVALGERVLLEVAVGARGRVAAVQADRLVLPLPGQAEVAPGRDVLRRAALARLGEDRVELLQREARDRVVLVD